MEQTQDFVSFVRQYEALIDGAAQARPYDLLASCARLLPRIYAAGLDLPDLYADRDIEETSLVSSPMSALLTLLGAVDRYFEVFDPVYDREAIAASLSDDLADIYLDLVRPLRQFDAGLQSEAVWQWRFNVRGHCGDHIVDALRAIHRLVNDHLDPDYRAGADALG
jgi:hypothetical protein